MSINNLDYFVEWQMMKDKEVTLRYEIEPKLLEPVLLWSDFGHVLTVAFCKICAGRWHFYDSCRALSSTFLAAGNPFPKKPWPRKRNCSGEHKKDTDKIAAYNSHFLCTRKAYLLPKTWLSYPIYTSLLLYNLLCSEKFHTRMIFNDIFYFK